MHKARPVSTIRAMPDGDRPDHPDRVAMRAHAKINLALAVAPPIREPGPTQGMHPIASWMVPIGLADEVEIVRAPATDSEYDIALADGSPVAWDIGSDLAVRAHRAIEHAAGRPLPVLLTIRKSIPAGGGLGGGSADAAAVLRGLNHLYSLGFDAGRLRTIASTLGSDIPFFIPDDPGPASPLGGALVTGLGDTIEPAPVLGFADAPHGDPIPLTLVFPPFGCPTGEVYRAFDASLDVKTQFHADRVAAIAETGQIDSDVLFNDLARPACRVRPQLNEIMGSISQATGCPVHVSGSGSTLFVFGSWADRLRAVLPTECVAAETTVLSCSS
jgi:4-diphosphocytidyl-2-C-methyl-D-erythritol kinase